MCFVTTTAKTPGDNRHHALLEIAPTPIRVLPGVVLFGFSLPWVLVGLTTLLQRLSPPELQGRVYAAADAIITTPQTISIALGAALIGIVGIACCWWRWPRATPLPART